jgi:vacuolar-type H+-ATPase subunit E/Vma4
MSLDTILDVIRSSGEAQVGEIGKQAQARAKETLAQAHVESERLRQDARTKVALQASKESIRVVQQARLEALQIVGNVREALVEEVLRRTCEHLADVRSDPIYPKVIRFLLEEALHDLGTSLRNSEHPQLAADPRDREILEEVLRQMRLDLVVSYELDCQGGLVARSEDGRVLVINTLEARLERAIPYLRRYLAALFEETPVESFLPVQQT